ncbi:hypothetical protein M2158_007910 [Streptomyces sp. SAI-144]|uniref:hypothetical protein n=1 Tax=Streptomyces sp. SAI-144 TaxID=2940544 RepID=UPI002475FD47|nr:hypothetical protein [Streptomyces sp. SAI-144]MDH6439369.1 hypothetical protein [Streptomyces sp. SAI-144]
MPDTSTHRIADRLHQLFLELRSATSTLELLDADGQVPSPLPVRKLLRHTVTAQTLATNTTRLADDLASTIGAEPSTEQAKALAGMVAAVAQTSTAAHLFARIAETAASPAPQPGTTHAESHNGRALIDHATGRRDLRRASESVQTAGQHLDDHHAHQRFLADMRLPPRPPALPRSPTTSRP